jgi:hypothetical protein
VRQQNNLRLHSSTAVPVVVGVGWFVLGQHINVHVLKGDQEWAMWEAVLHGLGSGVCSALSVAPGCSEARLVAQHAAEEGGGGVYKSLQRHQQQKQHTTQTTKKRCLYIMGGGVCGNSTVCRYVAVLHRACCSLSQHRYMFRVCLWSGLCAVCGC